MAGEEQKGGYVHAAVLVRPDSFGEQIVRKMSVSGDMNKRPEPSLVGGESKNKAGDWKVVKVEE